MIDKINNNIYAAINKSPEDFYLFNDEISSLFGINYLHNTIIIDFLIIISLICAVYTILSKNPIISVLFLIGLYISVANYIILIGLQFIGLSYILIYVGAISILFIFILMLINIRISELQSNNINSTSLIIIVTIILNSVLYYALPIRNIINNFIYNYNYDNTKLFSVSNIEWNSAILENNTISSLGNTLYSDNLIFFLETSLILLLAMVGAIIITIKSTRY